MAPVSLRWLLGEPHRSHLDLWGIGLLGLFALIVIITVGWRWEIRSRWPHHPFRAVVQGLLVKGTGALSVLAGVAAAAHVLGWSVYGVPLFGGLVALVFTAIVVHWRFLVLPQLRRYERRHPEVAVVHARLRPVTAPWSEIPLIAGLAGGFVGYAAFVWHPWSHAYHMGMFVLGGLASYVVACVVVTWSAGVPPVSPQSRGRTRRG